MHLFNDVVSSGLAELVLDLKCNEVRSFVLNNIINATYKIIFLSVLHLRDITDTRK
jgi:hypothetical protein